MDSAASGGTGGNCTNFGYLLEKPQSLRITVEVACVLSMVGSMVIILTYGCYREHRTRARYILVHLSISNIGQVISNFTGTAVNFDRTFSQSGNFSYDILHTRNRSIDEYLCTAQAFFTVYFSVCGMLWTICLAVYFYLVILSMKQVYFTRYFVWLGYGICYGLSLLISVWLLLTSRLGYAPYSTPGYCGLMTRRPFQKTGQIKCDPVRDVYGEFMGYDIWVFLTIFLTLLFYSSALYYLKYQHKEQISDSANFWKTVENIDFKFIAIPLTFALLRIWSLVVYLLFTYIGIDAANEEHTNIIMSMVYLMGIGNCAQGLIDAVLFVAFTPTIRKKLVSVIMCRGRMLEKPTRFFKESKNYYENNLRNYSPRYSLFSSSPINIVSTRITASPEPSTSFQESPRDDDYFNNYSIQNEQSNRQVYYSNS